jgi:tetratricopeptide (TPR) repeat protein
MKRKKWWLFLAGALAFIIGFLSTLRSAPAQQTDRFDLKVRESFFAGFAGDKEALARGMKASEELLAANPKNAEALVWHGSGLTFQSGQSFSAGDQQKGMELWTKGLKEMQTAVDLAPESAPVRIARGADLLAVSRFVTDPELVQSLVKDGVSDYERVYQIQKSYFNTLGTHPRGELLFGIAEGYSRLGDDEKARKYFEQIRADLPDTPYAKRASTFLEAGKLEETRCIGCHNPHN